MAETEAWMDETTRRLRRAVAGLRRKRRNEAVPRVLRAALVREAAGQRRAGRSWESIAQALGVSSSGLQRWCSTTAPASGRVARLRPVRVRAMQAGAAGGLVLVTASGHRVEGLGVADAAALVRALA
jgi:hypothetical protein